MEKTDNKQTNNDQEKHDIAINSMQLFKLGHIKGLAEKIEYFEKAVLAQAAITHYHRLVGLNIKYLFLTVLDVRNSKDKVSADSVSSKDPLPDSQMGLPGYILILWRDRSCL